MSVVHRVRLPAGATPLVEVGAQVEPAETLAMRRTIVNGLSIPVAARLRRPPLSAAGFVVPRPGSVVAAGEPLARDDHGRTVSDEADALFLAYDQREGLATVARLGAPEPIVGHVRGEVASVGVDHIEIRVAGALVGGIGGSGAAVHGELAIAVDDPRDELRAGSIDVAAAGRIIIGGSRASAETLTRARAIGVAGLVLGGVLDKELRDFEASQARRREVGGDRGELAILVLEGYGKVGIDADLFAWFRATEGNMASLFGSQARLYVYDADPPPARRRLPRAGDRVLAHRRPHAGIGGRVVRVLDEDRATPAGVVARAALVRFDDGRSAVVPLANLEATEPHTGS